MTQPIVKWAQREDKIFITIEVTDVQDEVITLKPEGVLTFKGKGGPNKEDFACELELFGEIDVDSSKRLVNPHQLFFTLTKKESGPYWPRLTKDKTRKHWLKIDFDKWKDEDDDDEEEQQKPDDYNMPGMQNFDMAQMMAQMQGGGGGGMPGMGGGGMPDMAQMMAGMGGGGGMPGMGGGEMPDLGGLGGDMPGVAGGDDDDADSDDEDMPELE